MLKTLHILMILTSHATIADTGHATGVWFEELTTPYYAFVDAGAEVDIVSIAGGRVPVDPASIAADGKNPQSVERFLKDKAAMAKIEHSVKIDAASPEKYDAVFMPGGHGTMWDLATSTTLANFLTTAWKEKKVIAAVCHGPAGLVNAKDETGKPLVSGRRVAGFTNEEEEGAGMSKSVPFLLETRLRELGAHYEKGPKFSVFALRDGRLVTGQNPPSSAETARLTLEAIRETSH